MLKKYLKYKLYSLKTSAQQTSPRDILGRLFELAQERGEFFLLRLVEVRENPGNAFFK
jgi:hypothetical protein